MGKSEWTDIHYLPGEKAQPQIKIDAEVLLDLLLRGRADDDEGVMHPRKRYQQHYSKGVDFLGAHIKFGRVFTNERTLRALRRRIRAWNRVASLRHLEGFLSSINSYLGLLKHSTNYGVIRDMVELVSPRWLKYCHYNDDRRCFEANDGYRHHDIFANTYKFKYHDSKRTKRAA